VNECNAQFENKGVTCSVKKKDGSTNTIVTFTGTKTSVDAAKQTAINTLIADLEGADPAVLTFDGSAKGFTDMPIEKPAQGLDEFVFYKEATRQTSGELHIKVEVHSRSCIDHTASDTGIRVDASTPDGITGASAFDWDLDTDDKVIKTIDAETNLCVETVTWKFTPIVDGSKHTIKLELDLLNGLGKFTVEAVVNIVKQNVLQTIAIRSEVATYSDDACSVLDNYFALGEKVVVKVTLNPIVTCASITIEEVVIKQTDTTKTPEVTTPTMWYEPKTVNGVTTNQADTKYKYKQLLTADVPNLSLTKNEIAFSGELESTDFHIDVDGFETKADIKLTCEFTQGVVGARMRIRRNLRWTKEYQVGSAKTTQVAQESNAEAIFHIVAPEQTLAEAFVEAVIPSGHFSRFALGLGLLLGGFLSFNAYNTNKQEEYNPLMEI
jgi:hypothetical protein